MKKILITGIEGFTGGHLEKFFKEKNFDVYGTAFNENSNEKHFTCDIRDRNKIESVVVDIEPDYIIHCAAISFVGEKNPALLYDVNVIGTQNLLEAAVKSGKQIEKIIIASSATIYGNQESFVLNENMCPAPVEHYGISKLAMENLARTYFNKLNIIVTRPFNYTGIGQAGHFLIPKIVKHYKKRKPVIELGNVDVSREFNDIKFVIEIYYKLMQSQHRSEVINVCTGKAIMLMDVIKMMNKIAGYDIEVKVNPSFIRKNEIKTLSGSVRKLNELNLLDSDYPLYNTLVEMYG